MQSTLDVIQAYADNPSGFLALNDGNSVFRADGVPGAVVYRPSGRYFLQFGGPFAPAEAQERLLTSFLSFAGEQKRRVLAVQLQAADAELYAVNGFTVNQLGASYAVDLTNFSLRGTAFMKLRNKISRAKRSGLDIAEVDPVAFEEQLDAVDRIWLRGKGRHVKPLRFLVGEHTGEWQKHRRLFVARRDEAVVAYITYVPAYGSRPGWLHDLSRRRPDEVPGVMEAVNVTAIEQFRKEGAAWLHFGFTPFTSLDPATEVSSASPAVARFIRLLANRGEMVYPAATQLAYKQKWGTNTVLPEYIAFHGRARLGGIWQLLRATNSI